MTISPDQFRAAWMLLCLSQVDLAKSAKVGVATIRRYETGLEVGSPQVELMRTAVGAAGAIFIGGSDACGRRIGNGVAVVADGDLPEETRGRGRPCTPRKDGGSLSVPRLTGPCRVRAKR